MANGTQTTSVGRSGPDGNRWFQLHKPTQGYWTRLFTAIGAGVLILWGASWIFNKLSVFHSSEYGLVVQVGAAIAYIVVLGAVLFWAAGKNPGTVDFLISVEGEMKKVNWSSWPEIIGSTKVVILFVVIISLMLFIVDTFFMLFFSQIGILRGPGFASIFEGLTKMFHH